MKAFISKYALTDGILEVDSDWVASEYGYVVAKGFCISFKAGKDIHRTFDEALAAAEVMRLRKIKSLEKQIDRVRNMSLKMATPA